ncbi:MAG: hypothetical protein ABJH45_15465 [Paracoccaceae bacterium]
MEVLEFSKKSTGHNVDLRCAVHELTHYGTFLPFDLQIALPDGDKPIASQSTAWSFAVEAIVNVSNGNATPAFYRDKEKNEFNLVLRFSSDAIYAIEMKLDEGGRTSCEHTPETCSVDAFDNS